jgi:hypothetical protein
MLASRRTSGKPSPAPRWSPVQRNRCRAEHRPRPRHPLRHQGSRCQAHDGEPHRPLGTAPHDGEGPGQAGEAQGRPEGQARDRHCSSPGPPGITSPDEEGLRLPRRFPSKAILVDMLSREQGRRWRSCLKLCPAAPSPGRKVSVKSGMNWDNEQGEGLRHPHHQARR